MTVQNNLNKISSPFLSTVDANEELTRVGFQLNLIVLIVFHFLVLEYMTVKQYCRNAAHCCLLQFCVRF